MMGSFFFKQKTAYDIATVLRDRLHAMGHEVMTVGDGKAAIDALQQVAPGLLFLDVHLPDPKLNGIEVLKRVRKEGPDLPAIVMTGFGSIPLAAEAMKGGA